MTASLIAPSLDILAALASNAMARLPDILKERTQGVAFVVEDFPDEEICAEMDLESPFDILGLYSGIPFGQAASAAATSDIDRIFLYRRPILDYWCETGEDLADIVRHVLVHEIGHHFGFSDEDMERIEAEPENSP